ncbi:vacuolar sorting protein VPS33/slp1 [Scheffersomyces coipomensis]|uniref:vacuolar sorting protein VPS33/slp1 n=1 Tax=Scheffersomyces coipomensis TaxID=1788519 RepID=UPI00315D9033
MPPQVTSPPTNASILSDSTASNNANSSSIPIETDTSGLNLDEFNHITVENLFSILSKIYSTNNLLILDQNLSPFINNLTTFSKLKQHGNFENIIWLNQQQQYQDLSIFQKFQSLIIIIDENHENLELVKQLLFTKLGILNSITGLKINLIVKDLSNSFVYELNKLCNGSHTFEGILKLNEIKTINIIPRVKVWNWETLPIFLEDILVIDIDSQFGGVDDYFNQPLKQVNSLANVLMQLLFIKNDENKVNYKNLLKLKNIYGKGNHSDLFIKLINETKIPEFLNLNLNDLEIEFYNTKLISNTDLVVIERNLDYYSVLLDQVNYHGLIDNLLDINFNKIQGQLDDDLASNKSLINDELYSNTLKNLNFSTLGPILNKLAKEIQQQFKQNQTESQNIQDMKNIVSKLGSLTQRQDLIKKHTNISESIINKLINFETFLQFQNEFFDIEYNLQISKLKYFLNLNFNYEIILSIMVLISIKNDGIKEKDFELINQQIQINYGLKVSLSLEKLVEFKLIRLIIDQSSTFLSVIGLSTTSSTTNQHILVNNNDENLNQLGITGAQDVYKNNFTLIDKFWNLHPNREDEEDININLQKLEVDNISLIDIYPHPSFTLPSNMVPLTYRLIESLYFRDFLVYKPINNVKKRPNWDNLGVGSMFKGKVNDINVDDKSDKRDTTTNGNGVRNLQSEVNTPASTPPPFQQKATTTTSTTTNSSLSPRKPLEYIVIVFIGGITRSEMTCLKYLQQKLIRNGKNKRIIVLTNGIINRKKLLNYFTT